eukprot:12569608-Prorocentrum_lima.AAC.1
MAGAATIVHVETDGAVHLQWQGNVLICACEDVRRALVYWHFLGADVFRSHNTDSPYHHVVQCLKAM